jgi:hypothetical protein
LPFVNIMICLLTLGWGAQTEACRSIGEMGKETRSFYTHISFVSAAWWEACIWRVLGGDSGVDDSVYYWTIISEVKVLNELITSR